MKAATPADGIRGYVTLLFADVCDYTALSEVTDPEEMDWLRREVERVGLSVVQAHGGSVNQFYGDGILAVFGFPAAREDDAKRAIEAALDLREAVRSIPSLPSNPGFELRLHMGIHSGLVFARSGDALHGAYELTGDAVNTAARLCAAAERDQVLVSESALRGHEGFFSRNTELELALKGKRVAVLAHEVTSRSAIRSRFAARTRRGMSELVARESELEELELTLNEAIDGRGRIVVLSGAAGIGKSRLLEELRARAGARAARLLFGCCSGSGEMVPLEPFIDGFRQLFGVEASTAVDEAVDALERELGTLGDGADAHLPTLLQLLSLPRRPSSTRRASAPARPVEEVLAELTRKLCDRGPLLLILDDWQWADDASRKLLSSIRRLCGERLGIVIAMRELDASDPALSGAREVRLPPFTERQTARAVRAMRPEEPDLRLAQAIHERSGGNPLFIEELCRSLPKDGGGEQLLETNETPPTLQGVIQARVAALPPDHAAILRAAAVIGTEFSVDLLARVARCDQAMVSKLVGEDVIYSLDRPDLFRFKHGITRDVIYETVRIAERRRIHHLVARVIEQTVAAEASADRTEALAYHYRGAGDHACAAQYAELAGNKAMAASALDRARFQYEAAFAALDQLPPSTENERRWIAVSVRWAGACVYNPAPYQIPLLQRARRYAEEVGERGALAKVHYWLGWIYYGLGEYAEAAAHSARALECASEVVDDWFVPQLYANLGQTHAAAGRFADALEALTRSIGSRRGSARHARAQHVSQGYAYSLASRASVFAAIGRFSAADEDMSDALSIVENTGVPVEGSVLALKAIVEIYRGDWARCAEAARDSAAVAKRVYSAYTFAISSACEAFARFSLTEEASALSDLRNAIQWLERSDSKLNISLVYGLMAEAAVSAGDLDSCADYANRALSRAAVGAALGEGMAYRALARRSMRLGEGSAKSVRKCLDEAYRAAQRRGSPRESALTRLFDAEFAAQRGELAAASRLANVALQEFENMHMKRYAERARLLLEQIGAD